MRNWSVISIGIRIIWGIQIIHVRILWDPPVFRSSKNVFYNLTCLHEIGSAFLKAFCEADNRFAIVTIIRASADDEHVEGHNTQHIKFLFANLLCQEIFNRANFFSTL